MISKTRSIAAIIITALFVSCSGPAKVPLLPQSNTRTHRHTMSGPSGIVINNKYDADTAFVSSITVPLNSPGEPTNGDLLVAVVYGYNSTTCNSMNTPTNWTLYDSACSTTPQKSTIWSFTKTATGTETNVQFSLVSGDDYFSAVVYDLGGASGIDTSADKQFVASESSQTTQSLTPTSGVPQSGDLAIASFGNANYNSDTIANPFTKDLQINDGVYLTVAHESLANPAATSATATYTAYPGDGGMTSLILVSSASSTAPTSTRSWVPIHAYIGTGGGGGGGLDPGPTEDQDLLYEIQAANFDPGSQNFQNGTVGSTPDCPQNANCIPVGYVSPIEDYCDYDVPTSAYNAADGHVEAGLTHNSSSIVNTNRFTISGGDCPAYGQVSGSVGSGSDIQVFNFHDKSNTTYSPYYWWHSEWPTLVNNESWKEIMVDNFAYGLPYTSNAPYEYSSIADWRSTVTTWLASLGYPIITNSLGPGGGYYVSNGAGGLTSFTGSPDGANGVVGWQVDVDDICSSIGSGQVNGLISEKPFATEASGTITYHSYNLKTLVNTVSHMWHDSGCAKTNVEMLNFASDGTTSNHNLRLYTKAADFFMQSTNYDGQIGTPTVVEWRYSTCITTCTNELAVLPEDELVFVPSTAKALSAFSWGGHSDGNGCQVSTGTDTGGLVPFAQECGVANQLDSGGYYTPVVVREGTCYRSGVSIGHCAAVIDTCDSSSCPTINLSSLTFAYTYSHQVTLSGGDLYSDPNTGTVLNPNETGGSMTVSSSSAPTSLTGCGANFQNQCAALLTP